MPTFELLPKNIDGVHVILVLIILIMLWQGSKKEGMMGQAQNALLSVTGGDLSRSGVRYLNPLSVANPDWEKTGVSVGAESVSRGIAANTTFGAHDAYYLGGVPYLPMYKK